MTITENKTQQGIQSAKNKHKNYDLQKHKYTLIQVSRRWHIFFHSNGTSDAKPNNRFLKTNVFTSPFDVAEAGMLRWRTQIIVKPQITGLIVSPSILAILLSPALLANCRLLTCLPKLSSLSWLTSDGLGPSVIAEVCADSLTDRSSMGSVSIDRSLGGCFN